MLVECAIMMRHFAHKRNAQEHFFRNLELTLISKFDIRKEYLFVINHKKSLIIRKSHILCHAQ